MNGNNVFPNRRVRLLEVPHLHLINSKGTASTRYDPIIPAHLNFKLNASVREGIEVVEFTVLVDVGDCEVLAGVEVFNLRVKRGGKWGG